MALGMGATLILPSEFDVDENGNIETSADAFVKIWTIKDAERIFPITIDDGDITECAFVRYETNKCHLQAHLKDDKGYYVIAEIEGTPTKKGTYTFDRESLKKLQTTSKIPFFQIWTPNIEDNKNNGQISTSVLANAIDEMKMVDLIMTSMFTEFKNGAKKRFISGKLQFKDENGNVANTPLDEEDYYIGEDLMGNSLPLQEFNGELRVPSHKEAMDFFLNMFSSKLGLGTEMFSFNGGSGRPLQTATAVISKQTDLYRTILKNENLATDNFKKMLMAIEFVNNEMTTNPKLTYAEEDIEVTYDDNIVEDTDSKRKNDLSDVQNNIMSIAEFRSKWYGEDIDQSKKFVQENALLIDKFLNALNSKAITPQKFSELVYGYVDNDLVAQLSQPTMDEFQYEEDAEEEIAEDEQGTREEAIAEESAREE